MVSLHVSDVSNSPDDWLFLDNLDLFSQLGVDLGSGESESELLSLAGHTRYLSEHASVNLTKSQG